MTELETKDSEVQRLLIKSKEADADILRKEMIIEGISEKVDIVLYMVIIVNEMSNNFMCEGACNLFWMV